MKVYINNSNRSEPRLLVEATLIREGSTVVIVRLPDGTVISRKKKRDLPEKTGEKPNA